MSTSLVPAGWWAALAIASSGACAGSASEPGQELEDGVQERGETGTQRAPDQEAQPVTGSVLEDQERDLIARLDATGVRGDRPSHATLYTWTTREQLEQLRRDPSLPLLSRSVSPAHGASGFDRALVGLGGSNPGVELLERADCGARRFAWSNPWAYSRGPAGEDYGDHLIEIRLRPDSIIASLDAVSRRWRYFDLEGRELDRASVEPIADRIAAVYHVSDRGRPYREFVVCNDLQVESWKFGDPATVEAMRESAALLRELSGVWAAAGDRATPLEAVRDPAWRGTTPVVDLHSAWAANLAWTDERTGSRAGIERFAGALDEAMAAMAKTEKLARDLDRLQLLERSEQRKRGRARQLEKSRKRRAKNKRRRDPLGTFGTY